MSQLSKKHSFHEVFDSQGVFRLVLEAMSNPTRKVSIKAYADKLFGDYPAMLALAMTLLDNEILFYSDNSTLSDDIAMLTLAKKSTMQDADFIFVCNYESLQAVIEGAKCGTLADPHKSATIIIYDERIVDCEALLHGPGIDGEITVSISQLIKTALQLRDNQYYEYPQGIDLLFVTDGGELLALPRLTRWEVL